MDRIARRPRRNHLRRIIARLRHDYDQAVFAIDDQADEYEAMLQFLRLELAQAQRACVSRPGGCGQQAETVS
jgi:hypothetical protein